MPRAQPTQAHEARQVRARKDLVRIGRWWLWGRALKVSTCCHLRGLETAPYQGLVAHLRCLGHGQESPGIWLSVYLALPPGTQPPVAWPRPGLPLGQHLFLV